MEYGDYFFKMILLSLITVFVLGYALGLYIDRLDKRIKNDGK
jgi:uncharacterized membrane protein